MIKCAGEPRLKLWLIGDLFERHAEPVVFAPYDAAIPACPIGLHDQREFVRNSYRIWNLKLRLCTPNLDNLRAKSPIVSGQCSKYSRFRETPTGDGVRRTLRGDAAACWLCHRGENTSPNGPRFGWSASGPPPQLDQDKEGAIPIISDVERFMGYYVVYAPDDTVVAMSIFNNYGGAEELNKRGLAWMEQDLAPLSPGRQQRWPGR